MDEIDVMQDAVLTERAEASDIEVSEEQVEEEVQLWVAALQQRMILDMDAGEYLDRIQNELPGRVAEYRKDVVRDLKIELFLKQLIEKEDFEVTPEELEAEAHAIAERQNTSVEMVKSFLGEDLHSVRHDIQVKKAIEFIHRQ
jgi:FKBP-type peptidyl-prolyl cis-trans isomerase (trigger factor)